MIAASLCGNPTHTWQTGAWSLLPTQGIILTGHIHCALPQTLQLLLSGCVITAKGDGDFLSHVPAENLLCPKGRSRETQAATSKSPGPHESFVVRLHCGRICRQVWTPNTSHCGHTAFSCHFPHPFPWAHENKETLLHAESLGAIVESRDGNDLPTSLEIAQPASFSCYWL